jgi:hypothetical protein
LWSAALLRRFQFVADPGTKGLPAADTEDSIVKTMFTET